MNGERRHINKKIIVLFIQLINYIKEKVVKNGIEVIFIDEAYTSKISYISGDILEVQTKSKNSQKPRANEFKGICAKRRLFRDTVLNYCELREEYTRKLRKFIIHNRLTKFDKFKIDRKYI